MVVVFEKLLNTSIPFFKANYFKTVNQRKTNPNVSKLLKQKFLNNMNLQYDFIVNN